MCARENHGCQSSHSTKKHGVRGGINQALKGHIKQEKDFFVKYLCGIVFLIHSTEMTDVNVRGGVIGQSRTGRNYSLFRGMNAGAE